jgi:hypothetical protein
VTVRVFVADAEAYRTFVTDSFSVIVPAATFVAVSAHDPLPPLSVIVV